MAQAKLLLDTNIVIDYLNQREPHYEAARLMMIAGYAGEFDLWISSSQITDLIYVLSNGGRKSEIPGVLEQLKGLRTFISVFAVSEREIDLMLAAAERDPEDHLLLEVAMALRCDAIITRNSGDFQSGLMPLHTCEEWFAWLKENRNLEYADMPF